MLIPLALAQTDEEFEFLCDAILLSRDGTEGPFYVQKDLLRSNITEDRRGLPLKLEIMVIDGECQPISDVWIDLWQADASGNYSGYQGETIAHFQSRARNALGTRRHQGNGHGCGAILNQYQST